jgi:hypothetical protein
MSERAVAYIPTADVFVEFLSRIAWGTGSSKNGRRTYLGKWM